MAAKTSNGHKPTTTLTLEARIAIEALNNRIAALRARIEDDSARIQKDGETLRQIMQNAGLDPAKTYRYDADGVAAEATA